MNRYALSFTVRPGTEPEVADLLRAYGRPRQPGGANTGVTLHRTTVFLAGNRIVRVVDVDGELAEVLGQLVAQPPIRAVEELLNEYLERPRNLDTPAGLAAFIEQAQLPAAFERVTDAELLPEVADTERGLRHAVLYPVLPGNGAKVAELLAAGPRLAVTTGTTSLAATMVFQRDDVVMRLIEVDGSVDAALDHLAVVAARAETSAILGGLVRSPHDLTSVEGFRAFLRDNSMSVLTDRRAGVLA